MSISTCTVCKKKMTVMSDCCVYCGGKLKRKRSKTGLIIAMILLLGIGFIGYTIVQTMFDAANDLSNSFETAVNEAVEDVVESTEIAIKQEVEVAIEETEEVTASEQYEVETTEEVADDNSYDNSENDDYESDETADDESNAADIEARRQHWAKFYRDKFPLPVAGELTTLTLKNRKTVRGDFMGVVGSVVKLIIDDELKSISKSKLTTRSRCRMFCTDYVEYFVDKRLKDENLIN